MTHLGKTYERLMKLIRFFPLAKIHRYSIQRYCY